MQTNTIKTYSITELVKIFGDKPQKDGDLHVHLSKNKFDEIPLQYPYRGSNYAFILVLKGTLTIQLNLNTHKVNSNEMIAVRPQTVIQLLKRSKDLEILSISFTFNFILKNNFKKTDFDSIDLFTAKSIPKLKLPLKEKELALLLANLIAKNNILNHKKEPFRNEIIKHSFGLFLYHFGALYKKEYPNLEANITRQKELTFRFFKILNTHFKEERTVQFYADILCITSGYLSKVLKEVSGRTASQLIDDVVILEAKLLLRNSMLSISEIANELKFSNLSFFGKYFKKHTGVSPSEFRKQQNT